MNIKLEKENKTKKITFNGTVIELLNKLKINPETVLVIKENKLQTRDNHLEDKDNVEILTVFSGG